MAKSLLALIMVAAAAAVITAVSAGGATGAGEIRITDVESLHTVSRARRWLLGLALRKGPGRGD